MSFSKTAVFFCQISDSTSWLFSLLKGSQTFKQQCTCKCSTQNKTQIVMSCRLYLQIVVIISLGNTSALLNCQETNHILASNCSNTLPNNLILSQSPNPAAVHSAKQ